MEKSNNYSSSVGLSGLLLILFIALKLIGVINWSWWLVIAPLWAPFALVFIAIIVIGFCAIIYEILKRYWENMGNILTNFYDKRN